MTMKVRDVMTSSPVVVDYSQPVNQAAQTMRDLSVGSLFVVQGGLLHGLVTDRDLVVRGVAEGVDPGAPVGPLSSADLIGVNADDDTVVALRLMRDQAVRRLPVLDDGQVTGVISLGDLALAEDAQSPLAQVRQASPNI
jgi:signal-transduction protein with cAMP-binding, CBS, and nucleotidyltransferase domain